MNEQKIAERLERLERQIKWHRGVLGLIALAAICLVIYGAADPIPDVIRARRFQAVDKKGRIAVSINSAMNRGNIMLYAGGEYPDNPSVHLFSINNGAGVIMLTNSLGDSTLVSGNGNVEIFNREGKKILYAGSNKEGEGTFVVFNAEATGGVMLNGKSRGAPGILIMNKNGAEVVHILADKNGNGIIRTFDKAGNEILPMPPASR